MPRARASDATETCGINVAANERTCNKTSTVHPEFCQLHASTNRCTFADNRRTNKKYTLKEIQATLGASAQSRPPQSPLQQSPTSQPTTGFVMDDRTIRTAVQALNNNRRNAAFRYGDISTWNTSHVTVMSNLFHDSSFNEPLDGWDTSNVTTMENMFKNASAFNQPLNFDTSNVTTMNNMFENASAFNQPLNFHTSNVTTMAKMFKYASAFNQSLNFDTRNVTDMDSMFYGARSLNQRLSFVDTRKVTSMSAMFWDASAFNQPTTFNTSNVTTMAHMFYYASAFNQPLNFDTRNVTTMYYMFHGARSFNQPLNFDITNVTRMDSMFGYAPFMTAMYPRGLGGEPPHVTPRVRWLQLQQQWAREWERIQRDEPVRAARIQRKHDSRITKMRDGDTQEGICVACLGNPAMFVFEKCKHLSACESCVGLYLRHSMDDRDVFACMLCRNPHRVGQIKSLTQWLSENLEHDEELRLSGGCSQMHRWAYSPFFPQSIL